MNYGELKTFVKSQLRVNTTELDTLIETHANIAYRKLARMALWPGLEMLDSTITAVGSQSLYSLPYPFEKLLPDSVRYDVTSTYAGRIIPITSGNKTQLYRALNPTQSTPQSVSVTGAAAALQNTGLVTVSNRGTSVTCDQPSFAGPQIGEWIVFYDDSTGATGGDYGYEIASLDDESTMTLATPYRGADLSGARFAIRPANSHRLSFAPAFSESNRQIVYSWQRRPERLFNPEDAMEVDALGDTVAWEVIKNLAVYHADAKLSAFAAGEARTEFIRAKSTLLL